MSGASLIMSTMRCFGLMRSLAKNGDIIHCGALVMSTMISIIATAAAGMMTAMICYNAVLCV